MNYGLYFIDISTKNDRLFSRIRKEFRGSLHVGDIYLLFTTLQGVFVQLKRLILLIPEQKKCLVDKKHKQLYAFISTWSVTLVIAVLGMEPYDLA